MGGQEDKISPAYFIQPRLGFGPATLKKGRLGSCVGVPSADKRRGLIDGRDEEPCIVAPPGGGFVDRLRASGPAGKTEEEVKIRQADIILGRSQ